MRCLKKFFDFALNLSISNFKGKPKVIYVLLILHGAELRYLHPSSRENAMTPVIDSNILAEETREDQTEGLSEGQSLVRLALSLVAEELDLLPQGRQCECGVTEWCEECEDELDDW